MINETVAKYIGESSTPTDNAEKSLANLITRYKDNGDSDRLEMAQGIMDHFKKEGSFSPKQAKWIANNFKNSDK